MNDVNNLNSCDSRQGRNVPPWPLAHFPQLVSRYLDSCVSTARTPRMWKEVAHFVTGSQSEATDCLLQRGKAALPRPCANPGGATGSSSEPVLPPGLLRGQRRAWPQGNFSTLGHLRAVWGTFLVVTRGEGCAAGISAQRAGVLLNTPQCTELSNPKHR